MVATDNIFFDNETYIKAGRKLAKVDDENSVVISGLAGVFPDADNVTDFAEKLFDKVDLISDDDRRWKLENPEIPQRTGKVRVVNKLDASYFGLHYNQAHSMDPMCRILLEKVYEAIVDSGTNPTELRGTKAGVFIGACFSESEKTWFYEKLQANGFAVTGCIRSMMANRISYWLGVDGPSCTLDTACSSSMYSFEYGYRAIREGLCDSAIIGGCNLCLHPFVSLQFSRLGVLSMDGRCKPFDEAANGYCRSEAICAVYLQKKKDARRIYATVIHAKTNCDGYKEQGITYPSGEIQQELLQDFYAECEVDPSTLAWVEANGTGTKVGDPEELKALVNMFCKGRTAPLKIGSVKSNIGHTEPASGLCSIAKVIIAMETGLIPPNINLNNPRSDIDALRDGTIEVVTDATPWDGGMVGINSFGFGGANCHVLLNWNEINKINGGAPTDDIPRLVNISGRTEEAVDMILNNLASIPLDREFCKLYHEIHKNDISGHVFRGFTLLNKSKLLAVTQYKSIQEFRKTKPLYFFFPGIYSERNILDKTLLQLPIFAEIMGKLSEILALDAFNLISSSSKQGMSNLINNFVGITAIQIAMVDLLKSIGVTPDKYVGSSIGEIACAYADGCLTVEEAILTSYSIAAGIIETELMEFTTATVGLAYFELRKQAPKEIEVSPINTKLSFVVGPKTVVANLISSLTKSNVSIREFNTCGQPLHSSFLSKASIKLTKYLQKVITREQAISNKWLTSVIKDECNAEYFCKNILESLQSEVTVKHIPDDAIVLEIGPNGKHIFSSTIQTLGLFDNSMNNISSLLVTIGKLYSMGFDMDPSALYPKVEFPVSRSTPMISPLIKWDHSEDWYVTSYKMQGKIKSGERTISISLNDDDLEYISGHVIDGRNLFPATGYLALVWETISLLRGEHYTEMPIVFENVRFHRATNLSKDGSIDFIVMIQKVSGNFEVVEGGAAIVTGKVYVPKDPSKEMSDVTPHTVTDYPMLTKDFYKELRLRGYNYKGLFRSVTCANYEECAGKVQWHNNWVAFMDNMLQLQIVLEDTRGLFVPTSMDSVIIDAKMHTKYLETFKDKKDIPVSVHKDLDMIKSGGIEIRGLRANAISRRKNLGDAVLEKYIFTPNKSTIEDCKIEDLVRIMVQLILENEPTIKVKVVELAANTSSLLSPLIAQSLSDLPLIQPEITVLANPSNPLVENLAPEIVVEDKKLSADQTALIVAASRIVQESDLGILESCLQAIKDGGYVITKEAIGSKLPVDYFTPIMSYVCDNEQVMLLRKAKSDVSGGIEIVEVSRENMNWLEKAQTAMSDEKVKKVYFVSQKDDLNGILGLVNCLRKEPGGTKARCVFTFDMDAPNFSIDDPFYSKQLSKDLAVNVYKNGKWGTYRHLLLDIPPFVKSQYAYINPLTRGDMSSLTWLQGNINDIINTEKNALTEVHYCALNFRDIMLTTGKIAPEVVAKGRFNLDCVVGFEYCGVCNGKRIMGLLNCKGLATYVKTNPLFSWEIPDDWTLEEAATVPVVYGTVVYGLLVQGKIQSGESILIHAGSGGVGQAAINLALHRGCTVFTTVGTQEKRNFLLQTYPQLSDRNIGNSRDTSFEQLVLKETNGRGVDLVLNSLSEEKLLASVRCLAKGGRFIEIGKFDLSNNSALGMELFMRGASFYGVMLDHTVEYGDTARILKLNKLMKDEILSGAIKPLCRTVFPINQVESAFRLMASGKHIGKVLIKISDTDPNDSLKRAENVFDCKARFYCDPKGSYIIAGGLGGFGLELADWLIIRGARNLILTSRRGITNGYQDMRIKLWKTYGAKILISTHDITTAEGVVGLLTEGEKLAPIKGIFNLAVVLKDGIFDNQSVEGYQASIGPKAQATIHFDHYTRKLCPQLDTFVVFSSVSCGRGNAGQTNYGLSNSIMERICELRHAEGLPGTAVQWGAVGDVGLVAEMQDEHIDIVIGGTLQQRISSCLEVLDEFLAQPVAIMSSMVVAEKRAGGSSSDNIVETVVNILGLRDLKTVSLHSTLAELGMDSMMAVEIKQTLEREFEVFLSPQDIRAMTFAKLYELSSSKEAEGQQEDGGGKVAVKTNFKMNLLINVIDDETEIFETMIKCKHSPNDSPNNQVFVAPGIEGFAAIVDPLIKNLACNVFCLQYDHKFPNETIEDISESVLPKIINQLAHGSTFNLVGYSFGGLIALDLTHKLEKLGYTGKTCLIDSSPVFMTAIAECCLHGDERTMQVKILLRYLDIFYPQNKAKVEAKLDELHDWNSRMDCIIEVCKSHHKHSPEYQKSVMTGVYNRIKAIYQYDSLGEKELSTSLLLIRPNEVSLPGEEDYGLSKYFKNKVTVNFVEGNHLTILNNQNTADIINRFMGLEETNNKISLLNTTASIPVIKENIKNI